MSEAITGFFSDTDPPVGVGPSQVSEAASGIVGNQLLRDIKLTYVTALAANALSTVTTTVTLNGGTKSNFVDLFRAGKPHGLRRFRRQPAVDVRGVNTCLKLGHGYANLTLASHTDGNGNETTFGSYDQNGNPTSIVEAAGTSEQRTTNVTYHPVLSHPDLPLNRVGKWRKSMRSISFIHGITPVDYFVQPGNVYTPKLTNHINSITDSGYTASSLPGTLDASETHTVQIQYVRDPCGGHTLVSGENRVSSISGPTVPPGQSTAYVYASYVVPQTTFDYSATTGYRAHETNLVGNGTLLTTTFNSYDADGRLLQTHRSQRNKHDHGIRWRGRHSKCYHNLSRWTRLA